tara:strand:- start:2859 stop:3128 length:270 start_codon:yes stop_codon:yes gene_type:complete
MKEEEKTKPGKPWNTDSTHETFNEALLRQGELSSQWAEDKVEGMQVKIKRRASSGKFVVKTRLHPDFEPKKPKKKTRKKKSKVTKNANK